MAKSAKAKQFCYDYPRPMVTVDMVIITDRPPRKVLLIRRKHDPHAGKWALPGGFLEMDESLDQAARRELLEETGVAVSQVHQLHTYGTPDRDPRGRVISVAYLAVTPVNSIQPKAGDDAAEAQWHSLAKPPELAFDHAIILKDARQYLKKK